MWKFNSGPFKHEDIIIPHRVPTRPQYQELLYHTFSRIECPFTHLHVAYSTNKRGVAIKNIP